MKFKCSECGRIYYADQHLSKCEICGESLESISIASEKAECTVGQSIVRLIRGIPNCDHFKLVNAMGNRCMKEGTPQRCKAAKLPQYSPRVGTKV